MFKKGTDRHEQKEESTNSLVILLNHKNLPQDEPQCTPHNSIRYNHLNEVGPSVWIVQIYK